MELRSPCCFLLGQPRKGRESHALKMTLREAFLQVLVMFATTSFVRIRNNYCPTYFHRSQYDTHALDDLGGRKMTSEKTAMK